jgi:ketosteroid isomerase-like protein
MRSVTVMLFALLLSISAIAQDTESKLLSELVALHAKWFKAFDTGDGATIDQMEMGNLVLVMPERIWPKTSARAGKQQKLDPQPERSLSEVFVRRFGNTAILTGILSTKSGQENSKEGTMVVFVQSSGTWKIASDSWTPMTK